MENRTTKVLYLYKYKYRLQGKIEIKTPFNGYDAEIKEGKKIFAQITKEGELTVFPGYAWDGMTGWFESRKSLIPSLIHDVLYQFIADDGSQIPKDKYIDLTDKYFMQLLKANKLNPISRGFIKIGIKFGRARAKYKHVEKVINYKA